MKTTICVIGGGSKVWALALMKDLYLEENLSGIIKLYDIDYAAAQSNETIGNRIFGQGSGSPSFSVHAEQNAETALEGADFVIVSIEPGPIEKRYVDLVIPEEFGIIQTVGDTVGPGGMFRALRSIPVFREYARLIAAHCPNAWVINYTNPMTWCTNTLTREFPELKVIGCCHEVFGTQKFIAEKVGTWFNTEVPNHKDIKLDICGVNHFTFATAASWDGHDLFPKLKELAENPATFNDNTAVALERIESEKWFDSDHLVALEFLKLFGSLGAAGDRHLAEFVPWYLKKEGDIHRYGVPLTPYSWRERTAREKYMKQFSDDDLKAESSDEEGVDIIKALLGIKPLYTNVNIPNNGQISWLPNTHVVETFAYLEKDAIHPVVAGIPEPPVQQMVTRVAEQQKLFLNGAFNGDKDKVFQAFLMDSLVSMSICQAENLFNAMAEKQGWPEHGI